MCIRDRATLGRAAEGLFPAVLGQHPTHDRAVLGGRAPRGAAVVEPRVLHHGAAAGALAALVVLEVLDRLPADRAEDVEYVVRGPVDAVLTGAPGDVHRASSASPP